jgi:hypothetical protein
MTLDPTLRAKLERLLSLIDSLESTVVAFSGGIDSTLVLWLAHNGLGARTIAVTAVSPTLPEEELKDCQRLAGEIGVAPVPDGPACDSRLCPERCVSLLSLQDGSLQSVGSDSIGTQLPNDGERRAG